LAVEYQRSSDFSSNTYKDLKVGLDSALKEAFAKAKHLARQEPAVVTFPGGTHDLWMRYWLAAGGINPEQDVSDCGAATADGTKRESRQHGNLCVGEPWPAQTVTQGIGYTAITTGELWKDHPEKADYASGL